MKYIIVIKTSGEVEVKSYEPNTKIELKELQAFVSGNIECVPSMFPGIEILYLPHDWGRGHEVTDEVCNEKEKLESQPTMHKLRYNAIATALLHPSFADTIVGDAVLIGLKKDSLDGMNEAAKEFIVKQIFEAVADMNKDNKDTAIRETLTFEVDEE